MTHPELVEIIGQDAAARLEAYAGGGTVYVPKPPQETKMAAIRREWSRGVLTPRQIAACIGCHPRTVYKYISPN